MLLVQCLNLPSATGIENSVWEKFQIDELNNDSMFGLERKCRQVGWSFTIAARGIADAILDGRSSVYNSINLKESQDKIRYAKAIYANLNTPFKKPRIITENRTEIEFDNGARLVSTASARGIPNANFFLDEAAWKHNAKEIYVASVPIISKGGCFRMGSSTNGAGGLFWEIDTQSFKEYPDFVRRQTVWWEVEAFCTISKPPLNKLRLWILRSVSKSSPAFD
jgi:phage FluMu gp28-like protein